MTDRGILKAEPLADMCASISEWDAGSQQKWRLCVLTWHIFTCDCVCVCIHFYELPARSSKVDKHASASGSV